MKNFLKFFGIIAIVAVIGFSMIACGGDSGGGGETGGKTMTWTAITQSVFEYDDSIKAIAYGNGIFVAGSGNSNSYSKMATSTDGITWTRVTDSTFYPDNEVAEKVPI
jgi:hypothetical protein